MSRLTLMKQLIDVLRQGGVERVYGVAGDSLNPVADAIRRTDGIEPTDVAAGLQDALAHPGPALVLGGGVGEMIQLARADLRNIPRPGGVP